MKRERVLINDIYKDRVLLVEGRFVLIHASIKEAGDFID